MTNTTQSSRTIPSNDTSIAITRQPQKHNSTTIATAATTTKATTITYPTQKFQWFDLYQIISIQNDLSLLQRSHDQEMFYRAFTSQIRREWTTLYDFLLFCKFGYGRRLVPSESGNRAGGEHLLRNESDGVSESVKNSDSGTNVEDDIQGETAIRSASTRTRTSHRLELDTLPVIPEPPHGYKWEAYLQDDDPSKVKERVIVRNDFPYYLEDGIDHYCLWKLNVSRENNDNENDNGASTTSTISSATATITTEDMEWAKEELKKAYDEDGKMVKDMLHWINPPNLKSLVLAFAWILHVQELAWNRACSYLMSP